MVPVSHINALVTEYETEPLHSNPYISGYPNNRLDIDSFAMLPSVFDEVPMISFSVQLTQLVAVALYHLFKSGVVITGGVLSSNCTTPQQ